jgi:DNA-binding transcriptional MerR regulator
VAKGPQAFRTISEAADELGVPQHVLRFWETRFSFIRPMKRAGGRRFYRPQDIAVLAGVQALLHRDGLTIKAVQALHKEQGTKALLNAAPQPTLQSAPVAAPAPFGAPAAPVDPAELDLPPFPEAGGDSDLFSRRPEPASPPAPAPTPGPRLSADGRVKLASTLTGLEEIKARLDGLLKP